MEKKTCGRGKKIERSTSRAVKDKWQEKDGGKGRRGVEEERELKKERESEREEILKKKNTQL